tara:strand:- start:9 stop:302 length:294 start_codon:yes stop_codon:yes gene_type:complete
MSSNTPIFKIAKDLGVDSNRIILACKTLGIYAKGTAKRLNKEELGKIINYFETGKNVSEEVVVLNESKVEKGSLKKNNTILKNKLKKIKFFPNRLIG